MLLSDWDKEHMTRALHYAEQAAQLGEVPIGALVVDAYGTLLGAGYNQTETKKSQVYHAEMIALASAGAQAGDWRLNKATLYVTVEPCMMCISAVALHRVERVVFGASSPLFGYRLDTEGVLALYTNEIKSITGGVLAEESATVMKAFFSKKRGAL
jgi:tRNA(adenine34) deaminase